MSTEIKRLIDFTNQDGVTHIRVDNRAQTLLGVMLNHQYISQFTHPELGQFNTTEGFWQYISSKKRYDVFRIYSGCECRKFAKDLAKDEGLVKIKLLNFYEQIKYANYLKISQNEHLRDLFIESTLPFMMYYVVNKGKKAELVRLQDSDFRLRNLNELRNEFKANKDFQMEMPDVSIVLKNHSES